MLKNNRSRGWRLAVGVLAVVAALWFVPDPSAAGATRIADKYPPVMSKVRVSGDGRHFVRGESGQAFVPWGFNYLGEFGALTEESWDTDWPSVERDFREMRRLGANVVRVHLQFGTYMTGPEQFDVKQLDRLQKLLDLAREVGLYLDVTGLGCYRLARSLHGTTSSMRPSVGGLRPAGGRRSPRRVPGIPRCSAMTW